MIFFPACKINLGLYVTARRPDGYHDIETVMVPVPGLCDAVEAVRQEAPCVEFTASGLPLDCPPQRNLCVRACELMRERYGIGGVKLHIHKVIPFGAGLGGGSSDAVAVLRLMNDIYNLDLADDALSELAAQLGSDTVFFVQNRPALATGRGEILTPTEVNLSGLWLRIVKPPLAVGTGEAYAGVAPAAPQRPLPEILAEGVQHWRDRLKNDFEPSVFRKYPRIGAVKERLYRQGAVYASMSGSGSAVYGFFRAEPPAWTEAPDDFVYDVRME